MKIGYMCKTDYDWHLENDRHPSKIYTSIENIKRDCKCVTSENHCGIVKVMISLEEVVQEENY